MKPKTYKLIIEARDLFLLTIAIMILTIGLSVIAKMTKKEAQSETDRRQLNEMKEYHKSQERDIIVFY